MKPKSLKALQREAERTRAAFRIAQEDQDAAGEEYLAATRETELRRKLMVEAEANLQRAEDQPK